jgi:hypothetical protein
MHPMLCALSIVVCENEDLSLITPDHPLIPTHKYNKKNVSFPDLPPPSGDFWWERLGMS